MENIIWLDEVTNEEVLRRVNEDKQISYWTLFGKKHRWIGHVLRQTDFCMKLLNAEWEGEEEFKCYMIWQR